MYAGDPPFLAVGFMLKHDESSIILQYTSVSGYRPFVATPRLYLQAIESGFLECGR